MILDKFKLDGKKAVVTGGTKGLGKAISLALAQAGAELALVSRRDNPDLRAEIEALGQGCMHYALIWPSASRPNGSYPSWQTRWVEWISW
jgi:NAD(P)-dependent dehydrogenase (short-subunit alcohol dehydrogenase family)